MIKASKQPDYPAEISLVISHLGPPGLEHAYEAGISTLALYISDRPSFFQMVEAALIGNNIDLVILAGFMRILPSDMVNRWQGRIINIHPSLLPDFPGLHPQRQAIEAGVPFSGCTVHYVVPQVDAGPIIAQAVVDVLPDDTEQTLSDRILEIEHVLYPIAVEVVAHKLLNEGTSRDKSPEYGIIQQSRLIH